MLDFDRDNPRALWVDLNHALMPYAPIRELKDGDVIPIGTTTDSDGSLVSYTGLYRLDNQKPGKATLEVTKKNETSTIETMTIFMHNITHHAVCPDDKDQRLAEIINWFGNEAMWY
jgi:hypothetical protein